MSVGVFLAEINIWIAGLRKVECPPQCVCISSNPLKASTEQKRGERMNLLFLSDCWAGTSVFSCPLTGTYTISSGSQAFRLGPNYTTSFLESPACSQQIMGFLGLYNPMNQFFILYFLLVLFFWRTLTNIQHFMSEELGPGKLTGIVNGEVRTETKVLYSNSNAVFFQAVLIKDSIE